MPGFLGKRKHQEKDTYTNVFEVSGNSNMHEYN